MNERRAEPVTVWQPSSRIAPLAQPRSSARAYAEVNAVLAPEHWDYDALLLPWQSHACVRRGERIARGGFSEVYVGLFVEADSTGEFQQRAEACAIKLIVDFSAQRLRREVKVLQSLAGGPNIVEWKALVPDPESGAATLIFEWVRSEDHRTLYPRLGVDAVRRYGFELLRAVDYAHRHGVMHRDIKPTNVLIDPESGRVCLIDWGSAEFYHPGVPYSPNVGHRYYRAPELLLGLIEYDYSCDLWSVGCLLAEQLFGLSPMFKGGDEVEQLAAILEFVGDDELIRFLSKYRLTPNEERLATGERGRERLPWAAVVLTNGLGERASTAALDLLDRLLRLDHQERLTAAEALAHPFFDGVRP